jgi:glycosyltransferase involved in cell wall biosynthesis
MNIVILSENLLLGNNGGAEIYALKLAEILKYRLSYNTTLLAYKYINRKTMSFSNIFKKYGINYINIKLIYTIYAKSFLKFLIRLYNIIGIHIFIKKGDVFINCSSNRLIGCSKSINLHIIHFPVKSYSYIIPIKAVASYLNNQYKYSYRDFLSNSQFTNKYLKEYWNIDGKVVYHPTNINEDTLDLSGKDKQIIIVGRIVPDKKIKEMMQVFIESKIYNTGYRLVVLGNVSSEYMWYYKEIKDLIENHDAISLKTNVNSIELKKYYLDSTIFWHGKGFNVEETNPLDMEHFGMTTVEAMSCGCIPIVINKAGQTEIVQHGISGFLWNSLDELVAFTLTTINNSEKETIALNALKRAEVFSMKSHVLFYSEYLKNI